MPLVTMSSLKTQLILGGGWNYEYGRDVAWCVWDGIESCRYIDTLEKLSKEEIKEQLL